MDKKVDSLQSKIEERNKLYVSRDNPQRLQQLINEIDYIYYGIKY
jgi:cell fate (sporulation/competence/biofilm development) regulator YlbF (YheA/YmcA/DUF963 family)